MHFAITWGKKKHFKNQIPKYQKKITLIFFWELIYLLEEK